MTALTLSQVDPVVTYRKKYICKQTSPEKPSEVVDWYGRQIVMCVPPARRTKGWSEASLQLTQSSPVGVK